MTEDLTALTQEERDELEKSTDEQLRPEDTGEGAPESADDLPMEATGADIANEGAGTQKILTQDNPTDEDVEAFIKEMEELRAKREEGTS